MRDGNTDCAVVAGGAEIGGSDGAGIASRAVESWGARTGNGAEGGAVAVGAWGAREARGGIYGAKIGLVGAVPALVRSPSCVETVGTNGANSANAAKDGSGGAVHECGADLAVVSSRAVEVGLSEATDGARHSGRALRALGDGGEIQRRAE